MVFFTCNACGTSLKKNQVEKHYQHVCPNCEVLSCIDCGLEFYGDAYASHTKCISEAEKYQGSLYKEGGAGKGERKQQEWVEVCFSLYQNLEVGLVLISAYQFCISLEFITFQSVTYMYPLVWCHIAYSCFIYAQLGTFRLLKIKLYMYHFALGQLKAIF